jgi:heme/copper-type cytochrome/quinol oxidase subunit 1
MSKLQRSCKTKHVLKVVKYTKNIYVIVSEDLRLRCRRVTSSINEQLHTKLWEQNIVHMTAYYSILQKHGLCKAFFFVCERGCFIKKVYKLIG